MTYIRWRIGTDIRGRLPFRLRVIAEVYTEVDAAGRVMREIGVDASGDVLHFAPSERDRFGLFDGQIIEPTTRPGDISPEAFEQLWRSAVGNR